MKTKIEWSEKTVMPLGRNLTRRAIDIADNVARADREERQRCDCGSMRTASMVFSVLLCMIPTFVFGVAVGLVIAKVLR